MARCFRLRRLRLHCCLIGELCVASLRFKDLRCRWALRKLGSRLNGALLAEVVPWLDLINTRLFNLGLLRSSSLLGQSQSFEATPLRWSDRQHIGLALGTLTIQKPVSLLHSCATPFGRFGFRRSVAGGMLCRVLARLLCVFLELRLELLKSVFRLLVLVSVPEVQQFLRDVSALFLLSRIIVLVVCLLNHLAKGRRVEGLLEPVIVQVLNQKLVVDRVLLCDVDLSPADGFLYEVIELGYAIEGRRQAHPL